MTNIWRKDITGLRALAVIPVLIFHAFPDLLPGGFYGVDIFFVISGYLISGIIFRGLISNTFRFSDFYSKRIKRIVPNLVSVLFFVAIIGWFVTSASEFKRIAANISHSAFFYQNFTLIKDDDYFGVLSQNNPLLHIWSLSIEEQFYLLFPLLCFLIWKLSKHSEWRLGAFVVGMTVVSFISCLLISEQTLRFYLPFTRFWELGVGICIAYAEIFLKINTRRYDSRWMDSFSVLGLGLILLAFFVPVSMYAPPPGIFSLIPVLGSAMLILSSANSLINRTLLSWNWVVFIGLISYSLYLWHWPMLAYVRIFFSEPTNSQLLITLLSSFLISFFVYRYIENPIRRIELSGSGLCIAVLLVLLSMSYFMGKVIREKEGVPDRYMAEAFNFQEDWPKMEGFVKHPEVDGLYVINANELPEIIFIGDSHMKQYQPRIVAQATTRHLNVGLMTHDGCMMSIGLNVPNERCSNANKQLEKFLRDKKIKRLVVAQKWGAYKEEMLENGINSYNEMIHTFKKLDSSRKVFLLKDNPWDESGNREFEIERFVPSRFNIKNKLSNLNVVVPLPKDDTWARGNKFVESKLKEKVIFIDVEQGLCPNGKCNLMNYKDNDHLRASYVEKNAIWIDRVFE